MRILVADDNPTVRKFLRGVLEQPEGWLVSDEVSDGRAAVERFKQAHHDLVVLDFQMPTINGLDAARQIAQESPTTPILMITLHMSPQLCLEMKRAGIRGACAKTDPGSILEAANAVIREQPYFEH